MSLYALKTASSPRQRLLLRIALAFQVLLLLPLGRRIVIYALVVACIGFSLGVRQSGRPLALSFGTRRLALVLATAVVIYAAVIFFFALRFTRGQSGPGISLADNIQKAVVVLQEGDPLLSSSLRKNVEERTFILTYFSDLLAASSQASPMLGEDAIMQIGSAVPSALWPKKLEVLGGISEEVLVNPHFGLPVGDLPNSLLTAGISDFGILGVLAYPVVMVAFLLFFMRLVNPLMSPWLGLGLSFVLIFIMLQAENGFTPCIVDCRDFFLLICLEVAAKKFLLPRISASRLLHIPSGSL
jgi:hypothetical protein